MGLFKGRPHNTIHSMPPLLVIITGLPCSGKTSLGLRLAQELRLPFIFKDGIKELLYDHLGWSDRQWSKRLGQATFPILFYFIEALLAAGYPAIAEGNFSPSIGTSTFLNLKEKVDFQPFQILCKADGEVLWQRFKARAESGERHPGHVDHTTYDEFQDVLLQGRLEPLDIGGQMVEVDTTDFSRVDYQGLSNAIRALL